MSGELLRWTVEEELRQNSSGYSWTAYGAGLFQRWRLNMGQAFAQGAFGRLYRGTYSGEEVAEKILERPENNLEKAMVMESAVSKEVTTLATVKH